MARRSSTWPFAHMPDAYGGCRCTTCGRDGVCIPIHHAEADGPGPLTDAGHHQLWDEDELAHDCEAGTCFT